MAILKGRWALGIEIRIFTGGGIVHAGLDIYDALRNYKGKKTGLVYAYARSMGATILQACDERVCLPYATVLIHHITSRVSLDELEDPGRFGKIIASMRKDQEIIYAILTERTGTSVDKIRNACRRDQDMSAREALEFGLIDRIASY